MKNVKPVNGLRNQMQKILNLLNKDEELLRLLHYEVNPLSKTHKDIIGSEEYWDIVEKHLFFGEKDSDLTDEKLCRVYIYTGRGRQLFARPYYKKQSFFINIIVHETFVDGMRLEQIHDRINYLLLHRQINGLSKITFEGSDPYQAPRQFETYLMTYSFLMNNKVCYD